MSEEKTIEALMKNDSFGDGFRSLTKLIEESGPQHFTTTIFSCARCRKDHENLEFTRLKNPSDNYCWFSMCPETSQPVLLKMTPVTE